MRPSILAFMILLLPFSTLAKADIVATCYSDCEAETDSNPTFKACLSRAANKADRLLNQSYQTLQEASARRPRTWISRPMTSSRR